MKMTSEKSQQPKPMHSSTTKKPLTKEQLLYADSLRKRAGEALEQAAARDKAGVDLSLPKK
jgi:hypothetical protein